MGVPKTPYIVGQNLIDRSDSAIVQDKKQVIVGMAAWGIVSLMFFDRDFAILGPSHVFFWLIFIRISFVILTLVIGWLLIGYVNQRSVFNLLVLVWGIFAALFGIVTNATKPLQPGSGYLIDLVAIFSFYIFIPNQLITRIIPPLLLTAYDFSVIMLNSKVYSQQEIGAVLFSFTITNLVGVLLTVFFIARQDKEKQVRIEEQRIRAELVRLATTDPLTGAYNRRRLIEIAGETFYRFHRYRRPFSVMVMDLDGFKQVNDTFGHQQGDMVLVEFVRMVNSERREIDALGRMGGDEFCLVLPETHAREAAAMGERILHRCANLDINHNAALAVKVSVSIGITEVQAQDQSVDYMISRADAALYSAKNAGKNQVALK